MDDKVTIELTKPTLARLAMVIQAYSTNSTLREAYDDILSVNDSAREAMNEAYIRDAVSNCDQIMLELLTEVLDNLFGVTNERSN